MVELKTGITILLDAKWAWGGLARAQIMVLLGACYRFPEKIGSQSWLTKVGE